MTREGDWVGDVGHLTLADTALSELLIDMLRMLDCGHLSAPPQEPDPGLTTKQAVGRVRKVREKTRRLLPDDVEDWLTEVAATADERNEILHAVALNRCANCGTATMFQHPRSGKLVDRSEAAVQALTERMLDLAEQGREIADAIAKLVNERIIVGAMLLADDTGESVWPEVVRPRENNLTCGACNGDGRATASVTVQLGFEVRPTGTMRALADSVRERDEQGRSPVEPDRPEA